MALGNASQTALAELLFQNIAMANVGDASGLQPSGTVGSLYVSLHTANPSASGNQNTNEAAYGSYARVAVVRSSSGWTVSGNQPTIIGNTAAVTFPQATSGNEIETYFAIGTAASGAGQILAWGSLNAPLPVVNGITPAFAIGALTASIN